MEPLGNLMIQDLISDFPIGCRWDIIICVYIFPHHYTYISLYLGRQVNSFQFLSGSPPSATCFVNMKPKKRKAIALTDLSLSAIGLLIIYRKSDL